MNSRSEAITVLLAHIEETQSLLSRIGRQYDEFLKTDFKRMGAKYTAGSSSSP